MEGECRVLPPRDWIRVSFNVCAFADVASGDSVKRVVFRCPMPHKLAETRCPGNIDEKMSSEVGAYIWVAEECPEIRPPHLFGFGTTDGRHVSFSSPHFSYRGAAHY